MNTSLPTDPDPAAIRSSIRYKVFRVTSWTEDEMGRHTAQELRDLALQYDLERYMEIKSRNDFLAMLMGAKMA